MIKLRAVTVGALMTVGYLGAANAMPIAPMTTTSVGNAAVESVSFWGQPFPYGYTYYRGQCYSYVPVETPTGYAWKRVFICTETNGRGYGHGYGGRF